MEGSIIKTLAFSIQKGGVGKTTLSGSVGFIAGRGFSRRRNMKKLLLLVVMLLLAASISAQFRGTEWGMTKEEVIKIEGDDYSEFPWGDSEHLVYKDEILGYDVDVDFVFLDDTLYRASYTFDSDGVDIFRSVLEDKYGKKSTTKSGFLYWKLDETVISMDLGPYPGIYYWPPVFVEKWKPEQLEKERLQAETYEEDEDKL